MLIAIFFTIYTALAIGGLFLLMGREELPIDEEKSPGSILLAAVFSGLGVWWVVATLGWTELTIFYTVWCIAGYVYAFLLVLATKRIYYPIWYTLFGLGVAVWMTVALWQHAVQ